MDVVEPREWRGPSGRITEGTPGNSTPASLSRLYPPTGGPWPWATPSRELVFKEPKAHGSYGTQRDSRVLPRPVAPLWGRIQSREARGGPHGPPVT